MKFMSECHALFILKIQEVGLSETLVSVYQTTLHDKPGIITVFTALEHQLLYEITRYQFCHSGI